MAHNAAARAGQALALFVTSVFLWVSSYEFWVRAFVVVTGAEGLVMAKPLVSVSYTRALDFAIESIEHVATFCLGSLAMLAT